MAEKEEILATYTVKPVVGARLLAESTVLVILALLPLTMLFVKEIAAAEFMIKLIVIALSVISIVALVSAGYLPFRVVATRDGLRTVAVLRRSYAAWSSIRTVKLVSKFGFRIYEVSGDKGALLFFPLWFKKVAELVQHVRARTPNRGRSIFQSDHTFERDTAVLVIQILKISAQILFLIVFWCFVASYRTTAAAKSEDIWIIIAAGIIFSGMTLWKLYLLLTMPGQVTISRDELVCKGLLGSRTLSRASIDSINPSNFLQPDGIIVKSGKTSVLIGAVFESFDELEEELAERPPADIHSS